MDEKEGKIHSLDMAQETAAALCYIPIFGVLLGLIFLVIEKNEKVRWHALQAILLWVGVVAADKLLEVSQVLTKFIGLVNLVGMILLPLILAIKTNQKEETRLPLVGELVDKLLAPGK